MDGWGEHYMEFGKTNKEKMNPKKAVKVVEKTATRTVEFTIGVLKWIFIILLFVISIATFLGYLERGNQFLVEIATLGVGGFWAFLFGYFGWRLGQSIEEFFQAAKKKGNE